MILLLILAVVSALALLNKRAVWLAAALCAGWGASFILEQHGLYSYIPYVDAAVFWMLLFLPAEVSGLRRTALIFIQTTVLCTHATFWWYYGHGEYHGEVYFWVLYATFLTMMGLIALGDFNVRSAIGAVLQGVRGAFHSGSRTGLAHSTPVAKEQEEGR